MPIWLLLYSKYNNDCLTDISKQPQKTAGAAEHVKRQMTGNYATLKNSHLWNCIFNTQSMNIVVTTCSYLWLCCWHCMMCCGYEHQFCWWLLYADTYCLIFCSFVASTYCLNSCLLIVYMMSIFCSNNCVFFMFEVLTLLFANVQKASNLCNIVVY